MSGYEDCVEGTSALDEVVRRVGITTMLRLLDLSDEIIEQGGRGVVLSGSDFEGGELGGLEIAVGSRQVELWVDDDRSYLLTRVCAAAILRQYEAPG